METPNQSWLGSTALSEPLRMLREEAGGKQGLPRGVLTAAAHGVGMGQLGEAWLAEVAALALHVLLADAAPRERVADGARHCAIRVALAGWKHERSGMAEEPGDRGGLREGMTRG